MNIIHYQNTHRLSNSYLIELGSDIVVLIDVGDFDIMELITRLKIKGQRLTHVIITHEHADHCSGLDELFEKNPFQLICTSKCEKNIRNSKQNFSFYVEEIKEFEVKLTSVLIVKDFEKIIIDGHTFTFIETPGHSPGGMCILIEDKMFTGDTILNNKKSTLIFPHSNRIEYKKSIDKIKKTIDSKKHIYPGHGLDFECSDIRKLSYL